MYQLRQESTSLVHRGYRLCLFDKPLVFCIKYFLKHFRTSLPTERQSCSNSSPCIGAFSLSRYPDSSWLKSGVTNFESATLDILMSALG